MSTLLFGKEDHSVHLRLASVIHAVSHVDHYIEMVCSLYNNNMVCHTLIIPQLKQALPEPDVAVQFLSTVSSSVTVVENRPKFNPSIDELHRFTLFTQILDTAKVGRDAGAVQP